MTRGTAQGSSSTAGAAAFAPSGHPVERFVAVLAVVALVLVAMWWSGAVAPRLSVSVSNRFDPQASTGEALVVVRNRGPLPARVRAPRAVERPEPGGFQQPTRLVDTTPGGEVRLGAGESARFTVTYLVDCAVAEATRTSRQGSVGPDLDLYLPVEGLLGVARSHRPRPSDHDLAELFRACGEPGWP